MEALRRQPDNSHYHFSLAQTYASEEKVQKSINSLKKAIDLKPEFPEAYFNLAGAMVFSGQEKQASGYLKKAVMIWRHQGKIVEAGDALNAFYVFLAQRKKEGKSGSSMDLTF